MDEFNWALPFSCLPPGNEDEWDNLSHFVNAYNSIYGMNYTPREFPEHENRNSPEPEVLLCDGDLKMVIERKVFPFPSDHIREHQLWHEMNDVIFEKLLDAFSDDLYVFEIETIDMPASRREMLVLVDEITNAVLMHEETIRTSGGIYSDGLNGDTKWSFSRVSSMDREDATVDYGIGVRLKGALPFYNQKQVGDSIKSVHLQLSKVISRTVPKFENYSDCIRVLVLEPHTNVLNFLPSIFKPAVQTLDIPVDIDQVWLVVQIELSDSESVLDYKLIHIGVTH